MLVPLVSLSVHFSFSLGANNSVCYAAPLQFFVKELYWNPNFSELCVGAATSICLCGVFCCVFGCVFSHSPFSQSSHPSLFDSWWEREYCAWIIPCGFFNCNNHPRSFSQSYLNCWWISHQNASCTPNAPSENHSSECLPHSETKTLICALISLVTDISWDCDLH